MKKYEKWPVFFMKKYEKGGKTVDFLRREN